MKSEVEEILVLLKQLQDGLDAGTRIGHKMVDHFKDQPIPCNVAEAFVVADAHCEMAGTAIGAAILYHIDDHDNDGDVTCASKVLTGYLGDILSTAVECVKAGCKDCCLENPFKEPDHNRAVMEDILAEIAHDEK